MASSPQRPANRKRGSSISQALSAIPLNTNTDNTKTLELPSPSIDNTPGAPLGAEQSQAQTRPKKEESASGGTPALQLNGSEQELARDQDAQAQLRQRKKHRATTSSSTDEDESAALRKAGGKKQRRGVKRGGPSDDEKRYISDGFWTDLRTGKWMLIPRTSLIMLLIPVILNLVWQHILTNPSIPRALPPLLQPLALALSKGSGSILPPTWTNPFEAMIYPPHPVLLDDGRRDPRDVFKRGPLDLLFIGYHIVFWCFVRQAVTMYILKPLAARLGIRGAKVERFTEQGYAIAYFGFFGSFGVWIMKDLPIWWYKTEAMWTTYPVIEAPRLLKVYYLLQFAYWLQQTIILAARVEKPRNDFRELVIHHLVTLWLVGWSYVTTLTYIGVAIFVTMDVSDIFLALAKVVNYVDESKSAPPFAFFVVVWTYLRHYLNLKILWSVWYEWKLIPAEARAGPFRPWKETNLMAPFLQMHIFAPIFLLQLVNLYWWFLILRILYRAVFQNVLADERSDDEGGDEEDDE